MMRPEPSFAVRVDVNNPGQFFACCGLLELAHRLWPGAEGWFEAPEFAMVVTGDYAGATLRVLLDQLCECELTALSENEEQERARLEQEYRESKRQGASLPAEKEARRKTLGEQARAGRLTLAEPFGLLLDWWETAGEEVPKTWAGRQELHQIACDAQEALRAAAEPSEVLDYACMLRAPFYFDARRFVHALDVGFSLDVQKAETVAHPAVELLALIGLQRFRPSSGPAKRSFEYWTWLNPLAATVAATVVSGAVAIPNTQRYRFPLHSRDDQNRYKAFGFATPIGDQI